MTQSVEKIGATSMSRISELRDTQTDDQSAEAPAAEIITGLDLVALEVFEPDMVGVKGYDVTILDVLPATMCASSRRSPTPIRSPIMSVRR